MLLITISIHTVLCFQSFCRTAVGVFSYADEETVRVRIGHVVLHAGVLVA